jgi:phage gpG-like protein
MPETDSVLRYRLTGVGNSRVTISFLNKAIYKHKTPLNRIKKRMKQLVELNFAEKGNTFGKPWKPLAPSTIAHKKWLALKGKQGVKAEYAEEILMRTGTMRNSFVYDVQKKPKGTQLVVRNKKRYFAKHQSTNPAVRTISLKDFTREGKAIKGRPKKVVLPRRVMLNINAKTEEEIIKIGQLWLNNQLDKIKAKDTGEAEGEWITL